MAAKKQVEPPKEHGAPAYMTMYTALMMLLLAFFIAILANATSSTQRGGMQQGIGSIKNSFGMQGGLGLMPYIKMVKNLRAVYPKVEEPPRDTEADRALLGHAKATTRQDLLMDEGFLSIKTIYRGVSLRVTAPIIFAAGSAALDQDAREFLQRIGGILTSFPEGLLTVRAYANETGHSGNDELLASERAAAIVRFLEQQSAIAPKRLRAVGCSSTRYMGTMPTGRKQALVLLINKMIDRVPAADLPATDATTTMEGT